MNQDEILKMFKGCGALQEGHFLLSSGYHSPTYFQCAMLLQYPDKAAYLGTLIKDRIEKVLDTNPTVVLSPAIGGIVLGHEVARAFSVRAIFGEREAGKMALRRGFSIARDDRVIIVEDVITTGSSVGELIDLAEKIGAQVQAVAAIVDRSGSKITFNVPFFSLVKLDTERYLPEDCPLCRDNEPFVKPGSR